MPSKHNRTRSRCRLNLRACKKRCGQALVEYVLIASITVLGMVSVANSFNTQLKKGNGMYIRIVNQLMIF